MIPEMHKTRSRSLCGGDSEGRSSRHPRRCGTQGRLLNDSALYRIPVRMQVFTCPLVTGIRQFSVA
jgi:hypothetical protein